MSGEVEDLTEALYADGELGPGYMLRDDCEHLAHRFLASPWLAARVASAEAERDEQIRTLAERLMEDDHECFKMICHQAGLERQRRMSPLTSAPWWGL